MDFFSRHATRSHIAIDLGSHSIKTAIFEKPAASIIPTNIQKITTDVTHASRGSSLLARLHELIAAVLKEKSHIPGKIVIGISPNIADISLQSWTVDSLRVRERFTLAHIQKYVQELIDKYQNETHAFLSYPVSIEINGYAVDIHSFVARDPSLIKEITLRAVMVQCTDEVALEFNTIKKMLGGIEIEFVPLPVVTAETLIKTCTIRDALLIDVGGSITTLMFIHDGRLVQFVSFPVGTQRFSHHIVKTRGGKFVEADDVTHQYSHGLISKDEQKELSHIFSEEAAEWKKAFMTALEACYPIAPLPEDFYLYGGGSYIPEVRSALWDRDIFKNFSPFESPHVHIVQVSHMFNGDSLKGIIRGPEDVGVASLMYHSLYPTPLF